MKFQSIVYWGPEDKTPKVSKLAIFKDELYVIWLFEDR